MMVQKKSGKKDSTSTGETKEMDFTCRFCGETKPFSEMVLLSRYFPVLTSCRDCDKTLQYLPLEGVPDEVNTETNAEEEAGEEEKPNE